MTRQNPWRSLLEGESAEKAWEAILDVAAAVRRLAVEDAAAAESPIGAGSVSQGRSGFALFFSYLAAARPDAVDRDLALECLNRAIDETAEETPRPAFYNGFPGVGWAVEHLKGRLYEAEEGEDGLHEEFDEMIFRMLGISEWRSSFDLISGLVGIGLYVLERIHRPRMQEAMELLLAHLETLSESTPEGVTWLTPARLLPPHQVETNPHGHYNLGMAHGVPGVIAFLGWVCRTGVGERRARKLLAGAVDWLLAHESPPDSAKRFGCWTSPETGTRPSRLAWCYGDPGVAAALLSAARGAGEPAWEDAALRIARSAAEHPLETAGVQDTGLCHGAAGLAHIFNRLHHATGDELFAAAARRWYRVTLAMRLPEHEVAGFPTWSPNPSENRNWREDHGILPGAAGVALALLAAVSPVEPEWDRILLTSVP